MRSAKDVETLALGGRGQGDAVHVFVRTALYDGTHRVFIALVVVAVLGAIIISFMPRKTAPLVFADVETAPTH